MEERHTKIGYFQELNRLHVEADAISRVLESNKKWLQGAQSSINNNDALPKLLDQCKVNIKFITKVSNLSFLVAP